MEVAPRPLYRRCSATSEAQTAPEDLELAATTPLGHMTCRAVSETPQSASQSPPKGRLHNQLSKKKKLQQGVSSAHKATTLAKSSNIVKSEAVSSVLQGEPVRCVTKPKAATTASATTSAKLGQSSTTEPSIHVAATVPCTRATSTATTSAIPSKPTASDANHMASRNAGTYGRWTAPLPRRFMTL